MESWTLNEVVPKRRAERNSIFMYVFTCTIWANHNIMNTSRQAVFTAFLVFCLLFSESFCVAEPQTRNVVLTGLDVLINEDFAPLRGKRVGLITNQSGVTGDGRSGIDALWQAAKAQEGKETGFALAALFSPEHGLRGRAAAGASVENSRDRATGLPIYSLYGKTQKPTPAMLRGLDTLVFDIQEIGSRSYTYISTLGLCMEAAAQNNLAFVVLDRPNPLGGLRVEGNIPAPAFRSFVGKYPVPYLHGLTVGELARLLNGERYLRQGAQCRLTVVPMQGWRRSMTWEETGLRWIPTSPHVPYARTSSYYAATGIVGELPALSIGIGTSLPFEVAGAPGLDADRYAKELTRRGLPGVRFTPTIWTPDHGVYSGRKCRGVHIEFTEASHCELTRLNFELMETARRVSPSLRFFADRETTRMFDLVNGIDSVRKGFEEGQSSAQIWADWNRGAEAFRSRRAPYLLYR
jgi:uncharacterized protein YbbC (DUF1343 family)